MGNAGSSHVPSIEDIRAQSGATDAELKRLKRRFAKVTGGPSRELTFRQFSSLPELAGNPAAAALFKQIDADGNGGISYAELAAFCGRAALFRAAARRAEAQRLQLLLSLHDADRDGKLSGKEVAAMLRAGAAQAFSEAQLQQTVEAIMGAYDVDADGLLSLQEFGALLEGSGGSLTS